MKNTQKPTKMENLKNFEFVEIIKNSATQRINTNAVQKSVRIMMYALENGINTKTDMVNLIASNSESPEELMVIMVSMIVITKKESSSELFLGEMLQSMFRADQAKVNPPSKDNPFGYIPIEEAETILELLRTIADSCEGTSIRSLVNAVKLHEKSTWIIMALFLYSLFASLFEESSERILN